jgi:hypothetical protein
MDTRVPSADGVVRPVPFERERWFVRSASRSEVDHVVDVAFEGAFACGCEQFMVRGLECPHIRAVKRHLAVPVDSLRS